MKWFSLNGIVKEIKKIRWPNKSDLFNNSIQAVIFIAFFASFFILCQFLVTLVLKMIGVSA